MSFISNSNNFFCQNHFIFREKSILLENITAHEKTAHDAADSECKTDNQANNSSSTKANVIISDKYILPSEEIIRKCMALQVADDWFAEPEYNYSAMNLEDSSPTPANCTFIPLRDFYNSADENLTQLASRAKSILSWRANTRFCSKCGTQLTDAKNLSAKLCPKCNSEIFPRIEPCIIVLVSDGDKYLLVRHAHRIQNLYACISGFVEAGETIEQCVRREVKEEVGINVKNIRYVGSQSWPFPDQLMFAFRAEYESGQIKVQEDEISEAAWFDKNNLPAIPAPGSVAHKLITGYFG